MAAIEVMTGPQLCVYMTVDFFHLSQGLCQECPWQLASEAESLSRKTLNAGKSIEFGYL